MEDTRKSPTWYNTHSPRNDTGNINSATVKEGFDLDNSKYLTLMHTLTTAFANSALDPRINPDAKLATLADRTLAVNIIKNIKANLILQYRWEHIPSTWTDSALYALAKHVLYNQKRKTPRPPRLHSPHTSVQNDQLSSSITSHNPFLAISSNAVRPSDLCRFSVRITSKTHSGQFEDILTSYLIAEALKKPADERTELDFDFRKLQTELANDNILPYDPDKHKLVYITSQGDFLTITCARHWRVALQDMWTRQQTHILHLSIQPHEYKDSRPKIAIPLISAHRSEQPSKNIISTSPTKQNLPSEHLAIEPYTNASIISTTDNSTLSRNYNTRGQKKRKRNDNNESQVLKVKKTNASTNNRPCSNRSKNIKPFPMAGSLMQGSTTDDKVTATKSSGNKKKDEIVNLGMLRENTVNDCENNLTTDSQAATVGKNTEKISQLTQNPSVNKLIDASWKDTCELFQIPNQPCAKEPEPYRLKGLSINLMPHQLLEIWSMLMQKSPHDTYQDFFYKDPDVGNTAHVVGLIAVRRLLFMAYEDMVRSYNSKLPDVQKRHLSKEINDISVSMAKCPSQSQWGIQCPCKKGGVAAKIMAAGLSGGPTLIISPSSAVSKWALKFAKFIEPESLLQLQTFIYHDLSNAQMKIDDYKQVVCNDTLCPPAGSERFVFITSANCLQPRLLDEFKQLILQPSPKRRGYKVIGQRDGLVWGLMVRDDLQLDHHLTAQVSIYLKLQATRNNPQIWELPRMP